ncbi:NACHT domain-containing protein [Listeria booriae]|uniref:NACHT domain-containing protein n=1 Tax=Listeria booriae TaxID=1552123 RepID=UPI001628DD5D|nr:hypothetical protein [Listeria booriae]MBC1802177.1 hypothetical protein [Listeria booriae]
MKIEVIGDFEVKKTAQRYWYSEEQAAYFMEQSVLDDFMLDTDKYMNNATIYKDIAWIPFLILLGEPGIGKSTELEKIRSNTTADKVYVDLSNCYNEENVVSNVFNNEQIETWKNNNSSMYLFLDSFDECQSRMPSIGILLIQEFQKLKAFKERLFVRITSRSTEWPSFFLDDIKKAWYPYKQVNQVINEVQIFNLAPLQLVNVTEVLRDKKINVDKFVQEAERAKVIPFLLRPVTLNMLINIYDENERFPTDIFDLYFNGCQRLCGEINSKRTEKTGKLPLASQKSFIIASRIAAISIFTNRNVFVLEQFCEDRNSIAISELANGSDYTLDESMQIEESDIRQVLETALFRSDGKKKYAWSHYSYAEFLAAYYILEMKLTDVQLETLLFENITVGVQSVNPLVETAVWVAAKNKNIRELLIENNPDIAIKSDLSHFSNVEKQLILENILLFLKEYKLDDFQLDLRSCISGLYFNNMEEILLKYIKDSQFNLLSRRQALLIYGYSGQEINEIIELLFGILNDPNENVLFKKECAMYIGQYGNANAKLDLRKFINDKKDFDFRLRGTILDILWPDLIETEEMLGYLMIRENELELYGAYELFITKIEESTMEEELDVYVKWLSQLNNDLFKSRRTDKLISRIRELLFNNYQESMQMVCKTIFNELTKNVPSSYERSRNFYLSLNSLEAISFWKNMMLIAPDLERFSNLIKYFRDSSENKEIIMYLINEYDYGVQFNKGYILKLVFMLFHYSLDSSVYEAIFRLMKKDEVAHRELDYYFEAIKLESDRAKDGRTLIRWARENKEESRESNKANMEMKECKNELDKFSLNRDTQFLFNALRIMAFDKYGNTKNTWESKIDETDIWKLLDKETENLIIEGMKIYLENVVEIECAKNETSVTYEQLLVFKILSYLWDNQKDILFELTLEKWMIFLPCIIKYPYSTGSEMEHKAIELIAVIHLKASNMIIRELIIQVEKENIDSDYLSILRLATRIWDEEWTEQIIDKYRTEKLTAKSFKYTLGNVPDAQMPSFNCFLLEIAQNINQASPYKMELLVNSVGTVLNNFKNEYWKLLWKHMNVDHDFGKEIIKELASCRRQEWISLTDEDVAELYKYTLVEYPEEDDPKHSGGVAHFVSPRDEIGEFRNGLITILREKGTKLSYQMLLEISQANPEKVWLKYSLNIARDNARRKIWQPVSTNELLQLVHSNKSTLINSEEELMALIKRLLDDLQFKLQCENPQVQFLWNEQKNENGSKVYTPKTENEFSDYVCQFLRERLDDKGIVANREVEIRRSGGSVSGERPDIIISAISQRQNEPYKPIELIIEVKGNWNKDLMIAMEEQLINRYLESNPNSCGLYLVGWFNSVKWDMTDRRSHAKKLSENEVIKRLKATQVKLDKKIVDFYVMDCSF